MISIKTNCSLVNPESAEHCCPSHAPVCQCGYHLSKMEDLDVKHTRVALEQCGSPLDNILQRVIANYARIADRLGPVSIAPGGAGSHVTSRQRESFRVIVCSVHSVENLDSICLQRLLPERRLNPAREGMGGDGDSSKVMDSIDGLFEGNAFRNVLFDADCENVSGHA